ncbi:hypothetical protein CGCF415_v009876 [Colletotrichum fructicola]|nr:hypothetical protein CGCSCA5_v007203 [Colletotrichum siamense]KAF4882338.1 hypothetical protein CGCFRS4_v014660 [Colletotrichum fructicola]KAF4900888.1 hypothetical protein CGCF415_v009876 [Colletotrichum fructicola]KAF4934292.1 hypothetical protein CGCF245_v008803 [Colletotrichum fructicola]
MFCIFQVHRPVRNPIVKPFQPH